MDPQQRRSDLRKLHGEQLEVSHHSRDYDVVGGKRLVSINPHDEVLAPGQVQGHRDAGFVSKRRLGVP